MVNARAKGASAERELCAILTDEMGTTVQRQLGAARDGGDDVKLKPWSIECKRQERIQLQKWWAQAVENSGNQKPMIALRWNRGEWLVITRLKDWIELAREEIVETANTQTRWQTGDERSTYGPASSATCTNEPSITPETNAGSDDLRASEWVNGELSATPVTK